MARIQSSEQLTALVEKLFEKRVPATVKLIRTDEGMEAEVILDSTGDLTTLTYSLVQSDLALNYDGANVSVLTQEEGLPEERTRE
jgi:hypothetical protein